MCEQTASYGRIDMTKLIVAFRNRTIFTEGYDIPSSVLQVSGISRHLYSGILNIGCNWW
jgi:hypothetical protein